MPACIAMESRLCCWGSQATGDPRPPCDRQDCGDAYIRMRGIREFYEAVRAKIPIKMELTKQSYGDSEFEVLDPNGYVLVFGEIID
jgi:hypothetical protein